MPPEPASRWTAIFAKRPVAGRVKTRLCPPLEAGQAARLAEAMLRDTVEKCRRSTAFRTLLVHAPAEEAAWFRAEFPEIEEQRPQRGDGLGARLARFVEEFFGENRGHTLVVIGGDQPLVPSARIAQAHEALEAGLGCVLGPDQGGGYYLIGLRASQPALFTDVAMSSAGMGAATAELARSLGLSVREFAPELDVDLPADLARLPDALESAWRSAERADFPWRTRALLRSLARRAPPGPRAAP